MMFDPLPILCLFLHTEWCLYIYWFLPLFSVSSERRIFCFFSHPSAQKVG